MGSDGKVRTVFGVAAWSKHVGFDGDATLDLYLRARR